MKVLKFGGSSVADASRLRAAARIVERQLDGCPADGAVVVSALGGVTDRLLALAAGAVEGNGGAETVREATALRDHHLNIAAEVAALADLPALRAALEELCDGLVRELDACERTGITAERPREAWIDRIVCHGELLSTQLLAAALRTRGLPAEARDARPLVRTDRSFQAALVELEPTMDAIAGHFAGLGEDGPLQVVTGFLGSTAEGETTTLGRSGSDLTASLVGAALDAERIEIWTDVPGVMTADPRRVEDALPIPRLSYEEMLELSHFGARVVYPPTVTPARRKAIPLLVRSTLDPEHPGTLVDAGRGRQRARGTAVTGISSIDDVHLMLLVGDNLVGTPGVAARLFDALAASGASAILISQASSEHSICFAVEPGVSEAARQAVEAEFRSEIESGSVRPLVVERDQSIVAVVGDGMRERPGIAGRVFGILGRRAVNVRAVAQGSSERNISMVVARADQGRAVRWIHREFFRGSASGRLALYVLGVGGVGSALLRQLAAERDALEQRGIDLQLRGLASSRFMELAGRRGGRRLDPGAAADPDGWRNALEQGGEPADLDRLLEHLGETAAGGGRTILVDVTASGAMSAVYHRALAAGAAVVSANKLPFAGPIADFRAFHADGGANVFHEATVGAGLPVLHTVDLLLGAGDPIESVSGVFSGTLAYLTGELSARQVWSDAVRRAHRLGYTEPDPRDDLGGLDVARKLLILARLCGADLEMDDVDVAPMLDRPDLKDLPLEDYWQRLASADEEMAARFAEARSAGLELAYLAELATGGEGATARVGLQAVPSDHPVAGMPASDNMFVFRSQRYNARPLIVQGPGAGTELTAGGVFGDILRAWSERGATP
ncbi:MAG: bifunctional aspartate kinase/homoserine dehydrogenase I [Holophagales bacterium]|nr:bifunctional aspartate kinase/homoserine dehydrogenase I [Holophagales bacterium]